MGFKEFDGYELVIRTGTYQVVLDVQSGDACVSKVAPGGWHIALRRRRLDT